MECIELPLGLKLIRPATFKDNRGFFLQSYQAAAYVAAGIDAEFTQDNHSRSVRGTLRGLHYQSHPGQAKLVRVGRGRIFDVAVDIRPDSPTFGQWHGVYLDDTEHAQLFVPVGFAHGFCVVSDIADVMYKVSTPYNAETECGLRYNDPEFGIEWPVDEPLLSARDQQTESFASYRARHGR
jgi:dTDP-4-dehydrorhamnose 3,5-epimerase